MILMRPLVVFEPVTDIYQFTTAQRRLLNSCLNREMFVIILYIVKKDVEEFCYWLILLNNSYVSTILCLDKSK